MNLYLYKNIIFNLSTNPNAIDLIKERIEYEKTLTQKQYNDLQNKIDWLNLSQNPSIFKVE
jgi:outer membrane PBP1 activator LpoA protein